MDTAGWRGEKIEKDAKWNKSQRWRRVQKEPSFFTRVAESLDNGKRKTSRIKGAYRLRWSEHRLVSEDAYTLLISDEPTGF